MTCPAGRVTSASLLAPVVSLDVLPADTPAEYAPAMARACSDALSDGECVLASSLPESAQPEAVALVLWQDQSYRQVTVRVARGTGQWVVRSLTFSDRDSPAERWIALGLTVATLVGEASAEPPSPVAEPASKTAPVSAPPKSPPASLRFAGLDAGLGGLAGPGWDSGGPQFGGWVSLAYRLASFPAAFGAFGSMASSVGPNLDGDDLRTVWQTVGISAAAVHTLRAIDLRGSAGIEVAIRRVQVELNGREATEREVPVRLRLLTSYPAESRASATAGAIIRLPPFSSAESDASHLRGPQLAAELVVGVEVHL